MSIEGNGFFFKDTIQQAACKFSVSCRNSRLQEGDVKYVIFLSRNNSGKETSSSLLLLYVILSYTFGQGRNDSRLCPCEFHSLENVHVVLRVYKSRFADLSSTTQH
jgi:hypothetical protein